MCHLSAIQIGLGIEGEDRRGEKGRRGPRYYCHVFDPLFLKCQSFKKQANIVCDKVYKDI